MRKIYMHGSIGKKYGKVVELEVQTAGEAICALCANFPGIMQDLNAGEWHIVRGKSVDNGVSLDGELICGLNLGRADLHILPRVAGSKRDGLLKTILGVALIGLSFGSAAFLAAPMLGIAGASTWGAALGALGLSLAVSGASTLLAPQKKDEKKDAESFVLNGPTNSQGQGGGVALVYGRVIVGGLLISGGVDIDQIDKSGNVVPALATQNSLTASFGANKSVGES